MVVQLLYAVVAPTPEQYWPLLRRLAGLVGKLLHPLYADYVHNLWLWA